MNAIALPSLRLVTLTTALFVLPFISAKDSSAPAADPVASTLAQAGSIPVKSVRHDEFNQSIGIGATQNTVYFRLGQPNDRLRDGSWLYRECTVDGSAAAGTLVVSFQNNRISKLVLVTRGVEKELSLTKNLPDPSKVLVASAPPR